MREELDIPMPAMSPSYRVPRRTEAGDAYTRRLLVIAGGIGGALLVIAGAWSLVGHSHSGVPVIEAAAGPVKVKPADPGGMQVAGQDESILAGGSKPDSQATLGPPPETPAPQALMAEAQLAAKPAPAASTSAPPAPAPVAAAAAPPAPVVALAPPAPVVAPKPEPKPAPPKLATAPKPMPAVVTAALRGPATLHGTQVQLAALTTEAAARAEWERLAKKMPTVLGGRKPAMLKIEHDGKTFWRLRTGGFADTAQAASFCEQVKAHGAGCEVTRS